jgi:ribosomal protein S27E
MIRSTTLSRPGRLAQKGQWVDMKCMECGNDNAENVTVLWEV